MRLGGFDFPEGESEVSETFLGQGAQFSSGVALVLNLHKCSNYVYLFDVILF